MNDKVTKFLNDLQTSSMQQFEIVSTIRQLFISSNTPLEEGFKYGGIVYSFSGSLIGGIFLYKNHLSIEFSYGTYFSDPYKVLEGQGKGRRHIKITDAKDIEKKSVPFYIQEINRHLPT